MAKESKERRKVKATLRKKDDKVSFTLSVYLKVSRMVQDLNRVARIDRLVGRDEVMYSLCRTGAPQGRFYVVRNY